MWIALIAIMAIQMIKEERRLSFSTLIYAQFSKSWMQIQKYGKRKQRLHACNLALPDGGLGEFQLVSIWKQSSCFLS